MKLSRIASLLVWIFLLGAPVGAQPGVVTYDDDFQSWGTPGEPTGWFDSAQGNPAREAPGLYKTWPDPLDRRGGNVVFGNKGASDSFTHQRDFLFGSEGLFTFEGRMIRTRDRVHLGVTFLSDFPDPESYYLLAQATDGGTVELSAVGAGPLSGDLDTGVSLDEDTWYRFRLETRAVEGGLALRAKVWPEAEPEPDTWSVEATDRVAPRQAGWIGLWAEGAGEAYWDDLEAESIPDIEPPEISIFDGDDLLISGLLVNRTVVPRVEVTDESPVTVEIRLNGEPFESGTPVSAEGVHLLEVTAVDVVGNRADAEREFAIDLTPPELLALDPPNGTLTAETLVTIRGQVTGAVSVSVSGQAATLAGELFEAGPFGLAEGENTFLITAADAAGNVRQVALVVVRDTTAPAITVEQPAAGSVVGSSPVLVAGTARDPHLAGVTVQGTPARIDGASFSASVPLNEGSNQLLIAAVDQVGNRSTTSLEVRLDTTAPTVRITETGQPLADGALFNRTVTPVVEVTDATDLAVEIRLDGAGFASGTPVEAEGVHELIVQATDEGGNVTTRHVTFEIDRTPPELGAVEPPDGTLQAEAQVTLSGTVTGGAVSVTVDGTPATLTAESFTAGPFTLPEGETVFEIVAADAAGNQTVRSHRIRRDSTPPVLTIVSPADGTAVAASPIEVSGTAVDPNLSEVRVAGLAADLVDDTFTVHNVPLSEGSNLLEVVATDAAGNVARETLEVILDTEPPVIRILDGGVELTDGSSFSRAVTPVIEVDDATETEVQATLDGAEFTSGTPVESEGTHELSVEAEDAAGNRSSAAVTFEVDVTPPTFLEVLPVADSIVSEDQVLLTGRVRGAEDVQVDGQPAELVGEDFTAGPFALAEGERIFQLAATDAVGNRVEQTHRIVRDATAPALTVTDPPEAELLGERAVTVLGEAGDPHLETVTVNGLDAELSGSSWLVRQVPLEEGDNVLDVRATDAAGNSATARRTVAVDTSDPQIQITDPADGTVVADEVVRLSGTARDAHLDRVEVEGLRAVVSGETWTVDLALDEGIQTLTAVAVDRLGHRSQTSVEVERDATAPALEILQPEEGAVVSTVEIPVSGTVERQAEVTVNGEPAQVVDGSFEAPQVPLVEGENRLIVRATDPAGNRATRTRIVFLDTEPPVLEAADPADGALAVSPDARFRLTFSEELAVLTAGAIRLATDGGSELTVELTPNAGNAEQVTVVPAAPLPSSAGLTLTVGSDIRDLAGNGLADPVTLRYTVGDGDAPGAPAVDAVPPFLCASSVLLTGGAEPGVKIVVSGGAAAAETQAGADGAFEVSVPLAPSTLHRFEVAAVDASGNRSPEASLDVFQDCRAPVVREAELLAPDLILVFSEPVVEASVLAPGAVTVSGDAGPLAGDLVFETQDRVVFHATETLPEGPVVLEVSQQVHDRAGNALAYPYSQVFGGDVGESFFSGAVLDDATGRPLAGARVVVVATDGVGVLEPRPQQTTAPDGRFLLPVPAGTHQVTFFRPGYAPVFRVVTTVAGRGTDVFDPRLTPEAPAETFGAAGGVYEPVPGGVQLTVPTDTVPEPTPVAATALSEQALPVLLPYGWSPRGGVWIDLGDVQPTRSMILSLPVDAPDGSTVVLARLDLASLQWKATEELVVDGGRVIAQVSSAGGFAAVEADSGVTAPPPVVIGEVLGSSPRPRGDEVTAAHLSFDPEVVLPAQRSRATVGYDLLEEAASGLPLTLVVEEELELLDGSLRRESPYRADLVMYRSSSGVPRSRFWLAPSESARTLPVALGAEDVTVVPYGGETVRGNVLGPGGGEVTSEEGDRVEVPAGALSEPTGIVLERRSVSELPLAVPTEPAGVQEIGALEFDLGGRTLTAPARIFFATPSTPETGSVGLLLRVTEWRNEDHWQAVAALEPASGGWITSVIDPEDLPWPGVRRGGSYLLVELATEPGYLRGTVFGISGAPRDGARVASPPLEWFQISGPSGAYVLPVEVGEPRVTADDPVSGDRADTVAQVQEPGQRVDLDLQVRVVAPEVVDTTPTDGATDVPPGVIPQVRFSEPVQRSSLAEGIQLLLDGVAQTVDFDHQGALVTILPAATLRPGAAYELAIGSGVRDLDGHGLGSPQTVRFTTQRVLVNEDLDLDRIRLIEPDAAGRATVLGDAGAVPADTLVFVENTSRLTETPSVTVGADGSFELEIPASVTDTLLLHVLLEGANEVVVELTPFMSADLRAAFVDERPARFVTADGITVIVPEGAFDEPTRVRVEPRGVEDAPAPPPRGFAPVLAVEVDFDGAQPNLPLEMRWPAPEGLADGDFLLNREVDALGEPRWMMHDLVRLEDGELTIEPADEGGEALRVRTARVHGTADGDLAQIQAPEGGEEMTVQRPRDLVPGLAFAGRYHVVQALEPFGYLGLPLAGLADSVAFNGDNGMVVTVNAAMERLLSFGSVLMPVALGRDTPVTLRDVETGFVTFEDVFGPPAEPGEIVELPPDTYDSDPPSPISGFPLRLFLLDPASSPETEPDSGITATFTGGQARIEGVAGTLAADVQVRLVGLEGSTVDAAVIAREDGSFLLETSASPDASYVLALGAVLASGEVVELRFDEALSDDFAGIDVLDELGRSIQPSIEPVGTREVVRIKPEAGWQAGERYTLELGPDLADAAGNRWGETLTLDFRVASSEILDTYPLERVRDVASLGSLLFLAADTRGLVVLDASDPDRLVNPVPGDLTFPFPFQDEVRGVAVDPHGRVLVAGGGITSPGQLKVFDPLALDAGAIAADPNRRFDAFRGGTIVSDQLATDAGSAFLPEGTPRRVAVLSDDAKTRWTAGDAPADDTVTVQPPPEGQGIFDLTVSGTGAAPGAPVTLRDLDRGRWVRVDADGSGAFSLTLPQVALGTRVELLRNRVSLAYVATLGAGVEVVDVNAFYGDSAGNEVPFESQVIGIYDGFGDPELTLCNEPVSDVGSMLDLATLFDAANEHPLVVGGLVGFRGMLLLESPQETPGALEFLNEQCGELASAGTDSRRVTGLEIVQGYRFDLDGDGALGAHETRDYALISHAGGAVLIYDVTDRTEIRLAGLIDLPGPAAKIGVDRTRRLLYVAAFSGGIYVVDFDLPPTPDPVDANQDGVDDRVLETIELPGNTSSGVHLSPELGLAFAGGQDRGLTSLRVGEPEIRVVARTVDGSLKTVDRLAPYGVPTGPHPEDSLFPSLPGSFQVVAHLPGGLGSEVRLDVESVGPGGVVIPKASAAGLHDELPSPSVELVLRRQADRPTDPGYQVYVSDEVAVVADLRAASGYQRTAREDDLCVRCQVPEGAVELLSGETVRVRFGDAVSAELETVYGAERLRAAQTEIASVRWEISPSTRQEPTLNPSLGVGTVAPGTLLHSGEMTSTSTDLVIRGRGFDYAFRRTYRNQTVGAGPLGPGWDFSYRQRLRELPNGDVEYYDGRGRRELFRKGSDGTLKAPVGRFWSLTRTASGFQLLDARHNLTRFDRFGRLTSIADFFKDSADTGNEMRFFYDLKSQLVRVVDTLDRDIRYEYDESGRLIAIEDFDGRRVEYEFDAHGRLTSVRSPVIEVGARSYPDGLVTRYEYEPASSFTGAEISLDQALNRRDELVACTDPKSQRWLEIDYGDQDGDGRAQEVVSQRWGEGTLGIVYDVTAGRTTVTDRGGDVHVFLHNAAGQWTRYEDPVDAVFTRNYDSEGLETLHVSSLGRVTESVYDTDGPRRSRGNALTVTVTADARGPNGSSEQLVTTVEYDRRTNQPTRLVDPRGIVTEIDRNAVGLATEIRDAVGSEDARNGSFRYNAFGQVTRHVNWNGNVTTYDYFRTGPSTGYLREEVVDPDGLALTTRYETDARGNVTAVIDPRQIRHERVYNEVDWLVEVTRGASASNDGAPALGYVTSYLYDRNGNLQELQRPFGIDGATFTSDRFAYGILDELLEVRREIEKGGPETVETYEYDPELLRTLRVEPDGQVTRYEYEARDLVARVTYGANDPAVAVVERLSYDLERQVKTFTDGRENIWSTQYDGYARPKVEADPLGNRMEMEYDDNSNETLVRNVEGGSDRLLAQSSTLYDQVDRPTEVRESLWTYSEGELGLPDTARDLVTRVTYDDYSNVTRMVDPEGRVTTHGYDAAERRQETIDPVGNRIVRDFDPASNVILVETFERTPEGGVVVVPEEMIYDAVHREATMTDALGNVMEYRYDARDNLRRVIDPEGFLTRHVYDGLDRRTNTIQPEGISQEWVFDDSSRVRIYRDAKGQETDYDYDAINRLTRVEYPDQTVWTREYDPSHNVSKIVDANLTVTRQSHDPANRLTGRVVTRAPGVVGPEVESYAYDGLYRLTRAQSGQVATDFTYDSASRQLSDTTAGRTIRYAHDDVDNPTQLTYPSGVVIDQVFDDLDRSEAIGQRIGPEELREAVRYAYRGPYLQKQKTLGNGVGLVREFDLARRLLREHGTTRTGSTVFDERITWSRRNLKTSETRSDLGRFAQVLGYDGAERIDTAARILLPAGQESSIPSNGRIPPSALDQAPEQFRFGYDPAQNLVAAVAVSDGVAAGATMPPEPSGRNRPDAVGDVDLSYDANGNLTGRGDETLSYDFRNRLTQVRAGDGSLVATYAYDALNRRVERQVGSTTEETVWNGWQAVEEYVNGSLSERRVFGRELDEIVLAQADVDGDGSLETEYSPLYDETGNVVALTGSDGQVFERYDYSPFGLSRTRVDAKPPAMGQVLLRNGRLRLEFDEPVVGDELRDAVGDGRLQLEQIFGDGTTEPVPVVIEQEADFVPEIPPLEPQGLIAESARAETEERASVDDLMGATVGARSTTPLASGQEIHFRRVLIRPTQPLEVGVQVRLAVAADAILDRFQNQASEGIEETFTWVSTGTQVIADQALPEIRAVRLRANRLEIEFSEEPHLATLSAISVAAPESPAWVLKDDSVTVTTEEPLPAGERQVTVGTGLTDLSGEPLAENFSVAVNVPATLVDLGILEAEEDGVLDVSSVGNRYGFHGRPVDPETGLHYFRHRYFDAELGRFISADPLGYLDSPSMYQYGLNSPANFIDPLGLETVVIVVGRGGEAGSMFEAAAETKRREVLSTWPEDTVEIYEWGKNISSKRALLEQLSRRRDDDEKIRELHYFGHSFGGGLAIGYGDESVSEVRSQFWFDRWGGSVPSNEASRERMLLEALEKDQGIIFRHDLSLNPDWLKRRAAVRENFTPTAEIYLWGCLTAVRSEFEDQPYWRLFRDFRPFNPLAKDLAAYFDRPTHGAAQGSSFEISNGGGWMSPEEFLETHERYFGSKAADFEDFRTRVVPDDGKLHEFVP